MPSERRFIDFTADELLDMLVRFTPVGEMKLGRGLTLRPTVKTAPQISVVLEVVDKDDRVVQTEILLMPVVVAAMMKYCMAEAIPIPRGASKSLHPWEHGASLGLMTKSAGAL